VGADGVLADLPLAAAGAPPTVPAAEVLVLADDSVPAAMLDQVTAAGGGTPRTVEDVVDDVSAEVGAVQAQSYALMAGFCLAVAVLVATSTVARQRAAHGREVAALRLLGVPRRTIRGSARLELSVLAVGAVAAAALGGLLAVRLLLRHLSLVTLPQHTAPLEIGIAVAPLALAAVAAAVLVALVSGRGRAVGADLGRPALLREEGAR
jgi:predicted lysophospholipase L1 biosynthesis ABC-type transport system permease subunit